MLCYKRFTTFILLAFVLNTSAQQRLRFEWFSHEAGISQHNISSVLRDKIGFVWLGTQDGLNRYDGYEFNVYRNDLEDPSSLSHKFIDFVADGHNGILWVVAGRKLNRFNTLTQKAERFSHSIKDRNSLSSDLINCVLVDRAGLVWIGTDKGLDAFDYEAKKWKHFSHDANDALSVSDNNIQCLYEDKKGRLWIGTSNGLNYYDKKSQQFVHYTHQANNSNSLANPWVKCLTESSDGAIWVGTKKGLNRLDGLRKNFVLYKHKPDDVNSLSSDEINGIVEDGRGILWIITNKGLNLLDRKTSVVTQHHPVMGDRQSLQTDVLKSIWKDQENLIWIGSADGLHKYNPQIDFFKNYTHNPQNKNSLSYRSAIPIYEDKQGILWIGTSGGGLNRFDRTHNKWTHYRHNPNNPNSISNDEIWHIIEDRNGYLWIMTIAALDRLDKKTGKFKHYFPNDNDPDALHGSTAVHEVLEDRNGNIWVPTHNGLNKLNTNTGKFQHFKHDPKNIATIGTNTPSCIKEARNGDLLIGSFGQGLDIYHPAAHAFKHFVHREGDSTSLNNQNVYCTHEDPKGKIWVGGDRGIDCLDPATGKVIVHYREKNGLPNETVYRIEEDKNGRLWISTNKGIARLNPVTNQITTFDVSDGIQGLEFNGYGSEQSKKTGEIFFGGINGVTAFHPESIKVDDYKPAVMITKMRLFKANASASIEVHLLDKSSVTLLPYENVIAFEFISLSLSKPSKNQYAYQLKGFSDQWYRLGTKREITFASLPSGNYTLLVKGANGDGVWNNTPAQLSLVVLPPWWQTWWAYGMYAVAIISTILLYTHYRSHHLKAENVRLESKVKERTSELKRSLDDLKETQHQLIQSEKMASLGELTAGIAHEIQNPLNFVNNFSEVSNEMIDELNAELMKGDIEEARIISADIKHNLEKINHHGKRADAIVKGMLQHSQTSKGQKQPTDINSLTEEYLRLAYHGLRAKDKSFNATLETTYDESIGSINIVPQDVGRAILNLITNAFYAVNEKKTLRQAQGDNTYEPTVSVSTKKTGRNVKIIVADNGPGIPQNILDKLFQPFFTTKPTGQGTGLGLSLAYDIIKAHGGEIKVETNEGEGSEFIIHLPTG